MLASFFRQIDVYGSKRDDTMTPVFNKSLFGIMPRKLARHSEVRSFDAGRKTSPLRFFCKYSIVSQLNLRTCIGKNHRTITFVQRSAFLAEKDSPRFPPSLYKHNSISMPNMCFYCFHIIFCTYEQNREASIAMTRDIQTTISFFRCLLCLPHVFEIITGQLAKRAQFISTHFFVPSYFFIIPKVWHWT